MTKEKQGRPPADEPLKERVTVLMTEKEKRKLKEEAERKNEPLSKFARGIIAKHTGGENQ